MMKFLALALFPISVWAQAPWSAEQARSESEAIVKQIIEGQSLLRYAIKTQDKSGWNGHVANRFDMTLAAFRAQRLELHNKNVERYGDCEGALLSYKFYAETFFREESMLNLQSRDSNDEDFKKYFSSCKQAIGWRGK